MVCKFHVRVTVALDVLAVDVEDAYELLNAWADALRDADHDGLKHLDSVTRCRPAFALADIKQVSKPVAVAEPVCILDPRRPLRPAGPPAPGLLQ